MRLNTLTPAKGSRKARKRLGRGVGSGTGKTAGRGTKGQKSRSGGSLRPGFEGGQMPIHRRLPKRGFTNIFKKNYALINLRDLNRFESGSIVDEAELVKSGLIKSRRDGIKLLGQGDIDYPLTLKIHKASKSAIDKIQAAGGSIDFI
jgi:large subunit ribosomal protein L15